VAHLSATPLPGGDSAIRHPRRVALSHLRTAGVPWDGDLPPVAATPGDELALLATQLDRGVAQVPTTSMGRLFDAVSSLLGVRHDITYEAQAAIELELLATGHAAAGGQGTPLRLRLDPRPDAPSVLRCDELVADLVAALRAGAAPAALALGFHEAVAAAVTTVATAQRDATTVVGLTGGVFANALLVELATDALTDAGFEVLRHRAVPTNDGGLALGQVALAVAGSSPVAAPDPLD
jgi:hydrogenase maturation protein HypF